MNTELLDIVDSNDNVIGVRTKEECHKNPKLIHRVVHFTLINTKTSKILITTRSLFKKIDPGKKCFLGEHVLSKEKWDDALIRGCKEELNYKVNNYIEVLNKIFKSKKQTEYAKFYIVFTKKEKFIFDKREISDLEWLSKNQLLRMKKDYSNMTKYWITNINLQKLFDWNN